MANQTIREIVATETVFNASNDYIEIDGSTDNTRKMLLTSLEAQIRNGASDAQMGYVAALTASDAELNTLDGFTGDVDDLNFLSGAIAGTSVASKAVVLSEAQNAAIGNNLTVGGTIAVTGISTLTGAVSCVSSLTMNGAGAIDLNGNDLIIDAAAGSKLYEKATAVVSLNLGSAEEYRFGATAFGCATAGANSLGGAIGVGGADTPKCFSNLNISGLINMGANDDPGVTPTDETCVIFMDSTSGNLMARIQHGGTTNLKTITTF